jgi:hypothetical protein
MTTSNKSFLNKLSALFLFCFDDVWVFRLFVILPTILHYSLVHHVSQADTHSLFIENSFSDWHLRARMIIMQAAAAVEISFNLKVFRSKFGASGMPCILKWTRERRVGVVKWVLKCWWSPFIRSFQEKDVAF